ncbi:Protein arg-6, mitochondrial, partial [Lunasporangiospora selenospora]
VPSSRPTMIIPYSLTNHIRGCEVSHQLGHEIHFMPHVALFFQRISLTVNIPLNKAMNLWTSVGIRELYEAAYESEKLVHVVKGGIPVVKACALEDLVFTRTARGGRLLSLGLGEYTVIPLD